MLRKIFNKHPPVEAQNLETFDFSNGAVKFLTRKEIGDAERAVLIGEGLLSNVVEVYQAGKLFCSFLFQYRGKSDPRQYAVLFERFLAVGFSENFYLVDLSDKRLIVFICNLGYVCGLRIENRRLLVVYNSGIYCFNQFGQIDWHNHQLGLDGIIVEKVVGNKILGSGQIDPPDGWNDFIIDLGTGLRI